MSFATASNKHLSIGRWGRRFSLRSELSGKEVLVAPQELRRHVTFVSGRDFCEELLFAPEHGHGLKSSQGNLSRFKNKGENAL